MCLIPVHRSFSDDAGTSQSAKERALGFRTETGVENTHIAAGAIFLLTLAAAAGVIILLRRRGHIGVAESHRGAISIRLLAAKRISARLTIFAIELGTKKTVILADNGHALVCLDVSGGEQDLQKPPSESESPR